MLGESGFIIIGLALATAVALLLVITYGPLRGVTRFVMRSFWCPFLERDVTVEFQEEAWDGRPVGVMRCTAFDPPTAITCQRRCLGLRRLPAGKARAA